mgnify:CR=1 FL=1
MTDKHKILEARINELEKSIADSREQFINRIDQLESELTTVRQLIEAGNNPEIAQTSETASEAYIREQYSGDSLVLQPEQTTLEPAPSINEATNPIAVNINKDESAGLKLNASIEQREVHPVNMSAVTEPRQPGFMELLIANFFHSILGLLLNSFTLLKAPFQELFHKLVKLYYHYQQQGKAPVFLMTIAGLITLTFGFGYLLQYSFNSLFNDTLKALSGFIIGGGIIGAGILLSLKKTDFREYAASIIALGVIFNYLTAYFIGPYYVLVSETTGLALLLGVTAISFMLAIVFETRVVSAVTLVGGMFMPFIIGDVESIGLVFMAYLLVLTCGNLYLSRRIQWPALAQLNFLLSLSVIEYIGISEAVFPMASITLLSAFFYLYSYFWTFDGVTLKGSLSKHDLTILVANVFYFIYAMLLVPAEPLMLATVLMIHAVVLSFTVKILRLMQTIMAPMYVLFIGLMVATAVFVLSPADVTSIIWAVEGLAMLTIGFRYSHKLIRAEGYAIYVIAMAGLLWQAIDAFIFMTPTGIAWHWINLLAFGVLSLIAYRIIYFFNDEATQAEHKAAFVQNEIFSLWGALALSLVIGMFFTAVMTVLAVIPLLWSLYRVARHKLRFAQLTGFIFILAFIVQIFWGIFDTQSTLLTDQSIISSIALLELLFFSWSLHFYFRYFELKGRGQLFATKIHNVIFYAPVVLIALCILNIFDRHITSFMPLDFNNIWIDFCVIGVLLFVAYWLISKTEKTEEGEAPAKHACLISESLSLYISIFFLYSIALLNLEWMFTTAVIPMFFLMYRALKKNLPLTEKLAWLHFAVMGAGILMSYLAVGNLHFSEQPWSVRIVMIEVLLSGWGMQLIYDRLNHDKGGYAFATKVRLLVYCLIPLLFLPRILRLYPDYFAVALWASFTISWLMYKKLKIAIILKELSLLFFIAIAATVLVSLNAMTGVQQLPGLIALIGGLTIVSIFHYVEKTLSLTDIKQSPYVLLQLSSPYFYAFIIAGLSYAISNHLTIALMMTGLYFLLITVDKRVRVVMHDSLSFSYTLTWLSLTAVPLMVFSDIFEQNLLLSNSFISIVTSIISLGGIWLLTHRQTPVLRLFSQKYFAKNNLYRVFHAFVLIVYIGSLNLLFSPWAVAISIAMLIHAVIILFLTLSQQFKGLLKLSIALYLLTAIKVLLYDMNDFGNLHKVFALMGIGSILMLAAFMFQKIRGQQF